MYIHIHYLSELSTCGKYSLFDIILKSTHLSIYCPIVDSACQGTNQAMKSKEFTLVIILRVPVKSYLAWNNEEKDLTWPWDWLSVNCPITSKLVKMS